MTNCRPSQLEEFNLNRACIHEAGHTVIALHFGVEVSSIEVVRSKPTVMVDLERMNPQVRFIFLAGGAAGECHRYKNYDQQGVAGDQQKIKEWLGGSITDYLSDALKIVAANDDRLNKLSEKLAWKWQCNSLGEAFEGGPENHVLLWKSEIDLI
jgi:hypothetical protein